MTKKPQLKKATLYNSDPTIVLVMDFWDCECPGPGDDFNDYSYIHPNKKQKCYKCGTPKSEGPNSRHPEVLAAGLINHSNEIL